MSKSTVISTVPLRLEEPKPGLIPNIYEIEPAPKGGFSSVVVNDGFQLVLMPLSDEKAPPIKIPVLSEQIAKSIIDDYVSASICIDFTPREDGAVAIPGLFWLPNEVSPAEIKAKHQAAVILATRNTRAWLEKVIVASDIEWAQTHSPKSITEIAKLACDFLGVIREWNFSTAQVPTLCWACKTAVNPDAMICLSCKAVINKDAYEKAKGQFATV